MINSFVVAQMHSAISLNRILSSSIIRLQLQSPSAAFREFHIQSTSRSWNLRRSNTIFQTNSLIKRFNSNEKPLAEEGPEIIHQIGTKADSLLSLSDSFPIIHNLSSYFSQLHSLSTDFKCS